MFLIFNPTLRSKHGNTQTNKAKHISEHV